LLQPADIWLALQDEVLPLRCDLWLHQVNFIEASGCLRKAKENSA
jgi:hypothetical protein